MENNSRYFVIVVGAGPAGLFATRELASQGAFVVLLNRDIRPGGLAEYGIYPDKHKMKDGLRNQFFPIVKDMERVRYFGNVKVGENGDFTIEALKSLGAQAILVTAGAQGTKWLGLPGESLNGVYHAKDIVYHYNCLPPFSERSFKIGKRVAVVGVGNVMTDIAHWLITEKKVDEVMAIARRGPAEVKFDKKELELVAANLDYEALDQEIERVRPIMEAVGQDPQNPRKLLYSARDKAVDHHSNTRFSLHFLASPTQILSDEKGNVSGLEVENNTLVLGPAGEVKARSIGSRQVFPVDTVIFAIGDRVDNGLGLPINGNEYLKNPNPRYPVEGQSYEVSPLSACLEGVFVAGWSRNASTGLVGVARKDGINGARAVIQYLEGLPVLDNNPAGRFIEELHHLDHPVVTGEDLVQLLAVEAVRGLEVGVDHFRFDNNDEMLQAMGLKEKIGRV